MDKVGYFEKVSFEQFRNDFLNCDYAGLYSDANIETIYNNIKLPKRATEGSAGYDFYLPMEVVIPLKNSIVIPTGIRCKMREGCFLWLTAKSGFGFKYGLRLANTAGIIDSDYYNSNNEGHILTKILLDNNIANNKLELDVGKSFVQGIFVQFGVTIDDSCSFIRNGGFGSTEK